MSTTTAADFNRAAAGKLADLLAREGLEILQQPDRVAAWLAYACPECRKENKLVLDALAAGVPVRMIDGQQTADLVEMVEREMCLSSTAARWVVDTWRAAIGGAAERNGVSAARRIGSAGKDLGERHDIEEIDLDGVVLHLKRIESSLWKYTNAQSGWLIVALFVLLGLVLVGYFAGLRYAASMSMVDGLLLMGTIAAGITVWVLLAKPAHKSDPKVLKKRGDALRAIDSFMASYPSIATSLGKEKLGDILVVRKLIAAWDAEIERQKPATSNQLRLPQ